jgi:thioredoxin-like negative regulator of GroEL
MISEINASEFESQVITSATPTLVEFFAERCSPCQSMLPILWEIATERTATLRVFKFDAGNDPEFASKFRVSAVPNFVLFQRGVPVGQRSGFVQKRELLAWIDSAIGR